MSVKGFVFLWRLGFRGSKLQNHGLGFYSFSV